MSGNAEIALCIGNRKSSRSVGMANNFNPVLIMVPCHRVVGKGNSIVGYAGGIERKQFLLDLEVANDLQGIAKHSNSEY